MAIDPDSPFARLAPPETSGAKKPTSIGWRYFGTKKCRDCSHEWNVPVVHGGAVGSACPTCHSTQTFLKDGSVQEAPPTRPW